MHSIFWLISPTNWHYILFTQFERVRRERTLSMWELNSYDKRLSDENQGNLLIRLLKPNRNDLLTHFLPFSQTCLNTCPQRNSHCNLQRNIAKCCKKSGGSARREPKITELLIVGAGDREKGGRLDQRAETTDNKVREGCLIYGITQQDQLKE